MQQQQKLFLQQSIIHLSASKLYGSQCVLVRIDVKPKEIGKNWGCYNRAGRENTGKYVVEWVKEIEDQAAGEMLIKSIERDGTLSGYDFRLIEKIVNSVKIPIIASGGAENYQHMIDAVNKSGAAAVAAASMFHFTEQTPAGVRAAKKGSGILVRNNFSLKNNFK
jgi:cyclase